MSAIARQHRSGGDSSTCTTFKCKILGSDIFSTYLSYNLTILSSGKSSNSFAIWRGKACCDRTLNLAGRCLPPNTLYVNDQEAPAQSAISEDTAESAKYQVLESNQDHDSSRDRERNPLRFHSNAEGGVLGTTLRSDECRNRRQRKSAAVPKSIQPRPTSRNILKVSYIVPYR